VLTDYNCNKKSLSFYSVMVREMVILRLHTSSFWRGNSRINKIMSLRYSHFIRPIQSRAREWLFWLQRSSCQQAEGEKQLFCSQLVSSYLQKVSENTVKYANSTSCHMWNSLTLMSLKSISGLL